MRLLRFFSIFVFILCMGTVSFAQNDTGGQKITFHYTLVVEGEMLETTVGKEPVTYIEGTSTIIPGLIKAISSMKVGESKDVRVMPEDAYGEINKEAFRNIPKSTFPKDFVAKKDMVLEFQTPEGETVPGIVSEIKEDFVVISFNHPLVGKTLDFKIDIVSVE